MISYDASNRLKVILSYQGTILPSVLSYMVWMLLWTGSLLFVFKFFELQFELGSQLHTFLGVALVFLLVMRTNSSYDRYWEGRKQLGALGITARNLGGGHKQKYRIIDFYRKKKGSKGEVERVEYDQIHLSTN